jgi:hypothetical protein
VEEYWETPQGRREVTHNFPYQLDEVRHIHGSVRLTTCSPLIPLITGIRGRMWCLNLENTFYY